jgi:hypothetical protein
MAKEVGNTLRIDRCFDVAVIAKDLRDRGVTVTSPGLVAIRTTPEAEPPRGRSGAELWNEKSEPSILQGQTGQTRRAAAPPLVAWRREPTLLCNTHIDV